MPLFHDDHLFLKARARDEAAYKELVAYFEAREQSSADTDENKISAETFSTRIMDIIPDVVYVYDMELQCNAYINHSVGEVLGYTPEEIAALGEGILLKIIHPEDLIIAEQEAQKLHNTPDGHFITITYRIRHKNGDWRWFQAREAAFKRNERGEITQRLGIAQDITEHVHSSERLLQSSNFMQRMTAIIPDLIYVYDMESDRNIYINHGIDDLLGYTPEEIDQMGSNLLPTLIHPDDFHVVHETMTKLLGVPDGEHVAAEYRMQHKNGEWRWFLSRDAVFERAEDGTIKKTLGIIHDITERKEWEKALQASETRFRQIAETVEAVFYIINPYTLEMEYVSPAYEQVWGRPLSELEDTLGFFRYVHPDDQEYAMQEVDKILKAVQDGSFNHGTMNYRIIWPDGSIRYVDYTTHVLRDDEGNIWRAIGFLRDVTPLKQTEEALRYAQRIYQTIGTYFPNGMIAVFDRDLICTFAEGQGITSIGLTSADFIGRSLMDIFGSSVAERDEAHLRAALAGQDRSMEVQFDDRIYLVQTAGINNSEGATDGVIVVTQDVTDYRQGIEERERLHQDLVEAKRISAWKDQVIRTVNHELRTPLSVIASSTDILARYFDKLESEQRHDRLHKIQAQIQQMKSLLEDLGFFTRGPRNGIRQERINLDDLVDEQIDVLQNGIGAEHSIIRSNTGSPTTIVGDPRLIRHLIVNLLTNAIKYSPDKQAIDIELIYQADQVELTVRDRGIGMGPEVVARIFEPFYRGDNIEQISGLGLGMSIVHDVIERHSGSIRVESTPDSGTCVIITLPYVPQSFSVSP